MARPALPDVAWQLYLASERLHGSEALRRYVEVNPPLFVWLAIPLVAVAQSLRVEPWHVLVWSTGLAIAASAVISTLILKRLTPGSGVGPLGGLGLAVLVALAVLPGAEFGQREHLALIATLPYAMLTAARASGVSPPPGLSLTAALIGAVGWSLKPHFLVPWLLLEVWLVTQVGFRRILRVESVVVVGFGLAYGCAVLLLSPDYLRQGLELRETYNHYLAVGPGLALAMSSRVWLPFAGVVGFLLSRRVDGPRFPLRDASMVVMLGFWVVVAIQGKGFPYHYVPAQGYALVVLVASVGLWWWRPLTSKSRPLVATGALLWATMLVLIGVSVNSVRKHDRGPYVAADYDELVMAVRQQAKGGAIGVLSSNIASAWPLTTDAGAQSALRYPSLWVLAGVYDTELWSGTRVPMFRPLSQRTGVELSFQRAVTEDLERSRPALLLVLGLDSTVQGFGGATRLDYLKYLNEDPRFRDFMADYDSLAPIGRLLVFRRRGAVREP